MNKYDILELGIRSYDFPDTERQLNKDSRPFEMKDVPKFTRENFLYLVEKHNQLVEFLSEHLGHCDEI